MGRHICTTLVVAVSSCVLSAPAVARAWHDHLRCRRRRRQIRRRLGRQVLRPDRSDRSDGRPFHCDLGPGASDDDPREGVPRPRDPRSVAARRRVSCCRCVRRAQLRSAAASSRRSVSRRTLRCLRRRIRASDVRDRERAEPAAFLAAAVPQRPLCCGTRLRTRARALVRRAEEGRQDDQGCGRCAFRTRQRRREGAEQPLDVAASVPLRPRQRLPRKQAQGAADGSLCVPSLSALVARLAAEGSRLADGGLCEPQPRQAGALGFVRRYGPADDRERARDHHRRGRLAGPRRVERRQQPVHRDRECAGRHARRTRPTSTRS